MTHVPYRGTGPMLTDLIAGRLDAASIGAAAVLQFVRTGKLRCIATGTTQRIAQLPDVPTVAESGYPGFAVETWFGLVAPAATPAAVVQKLHDAWAKGAKTAEAQAAFDNISGNLRVTTPQEFDAFIKAENNRWGSLIRKLDIKAN